MGFELVVFLLMNIMMISKSQWNPCETSDKPFHEWIDVRVSAYEHQLKWSSQDHMDSWRDSLGMNQEEFEVYLEEQFGPVYDAVPHLCLCNNDGSKGECYDEETYKTTNNETILGYKIEACTNIPDLKLCLNDWIYISPGYTCPRCGCNDTSSYQWLQTFDRYNNSNCYFCICYDDTSERYHQYNSSWHNYGFRYKVHDGDLPWFGECQWLDWSSAIEQETCPPSTTCVNPNAYYAHDLILKGGETELQTDSTDGNLECNFKECNATSGELVTFGFDELIINDEYQDSVKSMSEFRWYFLIGCLDEISRWQMTCDLNHHRKLSCECPEHKTEGDSWFTKEQFTNAFSEYNNITFETCVQCDCIKLKDDPDLTNPSNFGDDTTLFSECQDVGTDLSPILCHDNLITCKTRWDGDTYDQTCLKTDTCNDYNVMMYPEYLFSSIPRGIPSSGCSNNLICLVIGNDQCATSTVNEIIYRYNSTKDSAEEYTVYYENKMKCCNSENNCNENYNVTNEEDCYQSNTWNLMESVKWNDLFGIDDELRRNITEHLGRLEYIAQQQNRNNDFYINGFDILFNDFPCSDQYVAEFVTILVKTYCEMSSIAYNGIPEADKKELVQLYFEQDMEYWQSIVTKAGCVFVPQCNFTNGTGSLLIESYIVEFDVYLDDPILNETEFKRRLQDDLGEDNIVDLRQITITEPETDTPTQEPTAEPTKRTNNPTHTPSAYPTIGPTITTITPSLQPTNVPTVVPTNEPSVTPTEFPTKYPSITPTVNPSQTPTYLPTTYPTEIPTSDPTEAPTNTPTKIPTTTPTLTPSNVPTNTPTSSPSLSPTKQPSTPTVVPTVSPTVTDPTKSPTKKPTQTPTVTPSDSPTLTPTISPSNNPSITPTLNPSVTPTETPTKVPTESPTYNPTETPTNDPSLSPSQTPTLSPTFDPTFNPTTSPTLNPTNDPSASPTANPTLNPTKSPTLAPTQTPTKNPSASPTLTPTINPTTSPTKTPTVSPSQSPTDTPTSNPTSNPSITPTQSPSAFPTYNPSTNPTSTPTASPSVSPTQNPSLNPSITPTKSPSLTPSITPTKYPSIPPTLIPTKSPLNTPTLPPTSKPTNSPSIPPTLSPSIPPTLSPSNTPTHDPTYSPSQPPTSSNPTPSPTISPSMEPTTSMPTISPSFSPTLHTNSPSLHPTVSTLNPSSLPSISPTNSPANYPTTEPTMNPSNSPSIPTTIPTNTPSINPTLLPTLEPTNGPSAPTWNYNSWGTRWRRIQMNYWDYYRSRYGSSYSWGNSHYSIYYRSSYSYNYRSYTYRAWDINEAEIRPTTSPTTQESNAYSSLNTYIIPVIPVITVFGLFWM